MITNAKHLASSSVWVVNQQRITQHPVVMVRKAHKVSSKATTAIEIGALKVPLNFKNMTSLVAVAAHDEGSTQHPHSVAVDVSWPVSEEDKLAGVEQDSHVIHLKVQPEFNLPKPSPDKNKSLEFTLNHAAHLFWGIKRQDKADDAWNCELQFRDIVPVLAAPPVTGSIWTSETITETFNVRLPYIVNTVRVEADQELILKWQMLVKEKGSSKRDETWVDVLKNSETKRSKGGR